MKLIQKALVSIVAPAVVVAVTGAAHAAADYVVTVNTPTYSNNAQYNRIYMTGMVAGFGAACLLLPRQQ